MNRKQKLYGIFILKLFLKNSFWWSKIIPSYFDSVEICTKTNPQVSLHCSIHLVHIAHKPEVYEPELELQKIEKPTIFISTKRGILKIRSWDWSVLLKWSCLHCSIRLILMRLLTGSL